MTDTPKIIGITIPHVDHLVVGSKFTIIASWLQTVGYEPLFVATHQDVVGPIKEAGFAVILLELQSKDLDTVAAAKEFGSKAVVNSLEEDLPTVVKDLTRGIGADVVVECVAGNAIPDVLKDCISCLKLGGRLVVMGYGYGLQVSVDSADLIYGQWSILGTRASTLQDVVEVVRLVEDGKLKPLVSQRFPLEQANEAMASLQENAPLGRIVLT